MLLGGWSDIIEGNVFVILQTYATNNGLLLGCQKHISSTMCSSLFRGPPNAFPLEYTGLTSYSILLGSWPLAIRQKTQCGCAQVETVLNSHSKVRGPTELRDVHREWLAHQLLTRLPWHRRLPNTHIVTITSFACAGFPRAPSEEPFKAYGRHTCTA